MPMISTKPQIIFKNGRPSAVILDITKYEKILDLIEDKEDRNELQKIKNGKTSFRALKDYINKEKSV